MAGLERDVKTYPEAEDISKFVAFGFNSETEEGENLPGSSILSAIAAASKMIVVEQPFTYSGIMSIITSGKIPVMKIPNNEGKYAYLSHVGSDFIAFGSVEGADVHYFKIESDGDSIAQSATMASKAYVDGLIGKSFLITFDGTDGDKTQLEIYGVMSAGKVCLLYDSEWKQFAYGGLIGSGNTIYFYTTRPGSEGLTCTEYSVTSSNVWTRRQISNPGEAPVDNKAYGRWNGTWSEVSLKTYVDGLVGNVESLLAAL